MKEKNIKIFDILWLIFIISSITVVSIYSKANIVSMISSLSGVTYVFLLAKKKRFSLLFGMLTAALYGSILLGESQFGNSIYNLAYVLPMLIYSYATWNVKGKDEKKGSNDIKKLSRKNLIIVATVIIVLIVVYTIVASLIGIKYYFAIVDAVNLVIGIIGMIFLSKKYMEQWFCWITLNTVNIIYWAIRSYQEISNLPILLMWCIYLINNIYGYYNWHKMLKEEKGV